MRPPAPLYRPFLLAFEWAPTAPLLPTAGWHQRYKVGPALLRWKRPAAKSTCCSTKEVEDRAGHPAPGLSCCTHICTSIGAPNLPLLGALPWSPTRWCRTRFGALLAHRAHTRKQGVRSLITSSSSSSGHLPLAQSCPPQI